MATTRKKTTSKRNGAREVVRGRVKAHDPFDLIRWLALSQPDPRKALAELVQNSLDAGATQIRIARFRERGVACLKIRDDGAGVIPEKSRPDALRYIATHIGHSRKRSLSPQERLKLMTQGQYGIGLLGFWSLGQLLEMRSFVPGQRGYRLVLERDRARFVVEPIRGRLAVDERATEILITGLHRDAMSALIGNRAADYLASELRGQLLARDVELIIEDKISRRKALKHLVVKPARFLGRTDRRHRTGGGARTPTDPLRTLPLGRWSRVGSRAARHCSVRGRHHGRAAFVWEDSRRVVFQTAIVMFEVGSALARVRR